MTTIPFPTALDVSADASQAEVSLTSTAPEPIPHDMLTFAADVAEAFSATPMARSPGHLPGQFTAHFSPEQLFARTVMPPRAHDDVPIDFGLSETDCPVIHVDGIRFKHVVYWAPELGPYIESGEHRNRTFRLRYDAALLARGVLDSVVVIEVLPAGERVERVRCGRRDEALQSIDLDAVLRQRAIYEAQLLARVSHARDVKRELESGTVALTQLRDARLAREAYHNQARHAPEVAAPVTFEGSAKAREKATRESQRALSAVLSKDRTGRTKTAARRRAPRALLGTSETRSAVAADAVCDGSGEQTIARTELTLGCDTNGDSALVSAMATRAAWGQPEVASSVRERDDAVEPARRNARLPGGRRRRQPAGAQELGEPDASTSPPARVPSDAIGTPDDEFLPASTRAVSAPRIDEVPADVPEGVPALADGNVPPSPATPSMTPPSIASPSASVASGATTPQADPSRSTSDVLQYFRNLRQPATGR